MDEIGEAPALAASAGATMALPEPVLAFAGSLWSSVMPIAIFATSWPSLPSVGGCSTMTVGPFLRTAAASAAAGPRPAAAAAAPPVWVMVEHTAQRTLEAPCRYTRVVRQPSQFRWPMLFAVTELFSVEHTWGGADTSGRSLSKRYYTHSTSTEHGKTAKGTELIGRATGRNCARSTHRALHR